MRDFFTGLAVGILLTAFTGWYFAFGRKNESVQRAQVAVASGIGHAADSVTAKIDAFELRGKDIRADMAATGRVVRRSVRSVGTTIAETTSDPRITTSIKTRLTMDRDLSAWDISVSTSDGVVTLSGTVDRHEQIGKAMIIALETPGVKEVASTLRVKSG